MVPSLTAGNDKFSRTAVGYVRVSTDMQAADGLSLDAQREAIKHYCRANGLRLLAIHQDVESGGKADRKGLEATLATDADVVLVLKFDRLSRSIMHFCEMYQAHFEDGQKELVAIREAIRLDSALGRALVSILLVFAQMEREATGERVKETIAHIRKNGYHFGKVPYGHQAVPCQEKPRYRILVDDPAEQAVLAIIKAQVEAGIGNTEIAKSLTEQGKTPPQGQEWTDKLIYNLKVRKGWHTANAVNQREYTDAEVKAEMHRLREKGTTLKGVANILNESGYKPYKGKKFNEQSVCKLLGRVKITQVDTPKGFIENEIARLNGDRPSYPAIARMLSRAGFATPKGNTHWWPAQAKQLLNGAFDSYYDTAKGRRVESRPAAA